MRLGDMLLDFSKVNLDAHALTLLIQLAEARGVPERRDAMFRGDPINVTEGRAVLHTALRNRANTPVMVDGRDVMPEVNAVLERMGAFARSLRDGTYRGGGRREVHRRGQHRHRRQRPRAGDGDAGAGAVSRRAAAALRLEHRRRTYPRRSGRARSGKDAGDHRIQDLHHHRDDDERAHRPSLAEGQARQRRGRPFRRRLHRARQDGGLRDRPEPGVRVLGLGRRALFCLGRGRPAGDDRHRAGAVRRVPDRGLGDGPAFRRGAAAGEHAGAARTGRGLAPQRHGVCEPGGAAL